MQYKVVKDFRGSPDGCRVVDFRVGDIVSVGEDFPEDLLSVAKMEKWVSPINRKKTAARRSS